MLNDTAGMRDETELAHRKLIDFLWVRDGEIPKENEILRKLTGRSESSWFKIKGELLQNGWSEVGAYFIHRGAIKALNESKEKFVSNHNRTAAANELPRLKLLPPDAATGVTHYVTCDVTDGVTLCNKNKNKNNNEEGVPSNNPMIKAPMGGVGGNLTLPDQIAARINSNRDDWHYDNCKVPRDIASPPKSLVAVLKPFEASLSEESAIRAWRAAVSATHRAAVDGLVKGSVAGYCIACFKKQLKTESDHEISKKNEPR